MDCFYCQVEQVRLNLSPAVPLAIQQWQNVIAVNYAARAANVTRHASIQACLATCPELKLVHVPTFRMGGGMVVYGEGLNEPSRKEHKASLQPYREASGKVFQVMRNTVAAYGAPMVLEKASVDEVFLDVSDIVDMLLGRDYGFVIQRGRLLEEGTFETIDWPKYGKPAVPDDPDVIDGITDLRIAIGCQIAQRVREAVYKELQYTVSAGIAVNKTLAKLASARHKPNQQTYVRPSHIEEWMKIVPFTKIRFLGGKMGKLLLKTLEQREGNEAESGGENSAEEEESSTVMAADMHSFSLEELTQKLGNVESARWVYGVIRGHDPAPVAPRLQSKSFMSAKALSPSGKEWQTLNDWLLVLVTEIVGRLHEEQQIHKRWPQSLSVHYCKPKEKMKSKIADFPYEPGPIETDRLAEFCMALIVAERDVFPCSWVALSVSKFRHILEGSKRNLTMDSFVTKGAPATDAFAKVPDPKPKLVAKKRKDLTSYFPIKTGKAEGYQCNKCSKAFKSHDLETIQEHEDYHFALDLQKSIDLENT
jgi:DNA polymerase eta